MPMTIDIEAASELPEIRALDLSVFTPDDLMNLVLQRSEVLFDIPKSGRIIKAWNARDEGPIREVVERMGDRIARRAAAVIRAEYLTLAPAILAAKPKRIADIGCGYALFDLFAAKDTKADLILIDLEQNNRRHFGFAEKGAAYSNLDTARRLLEANGIKSSRITLINPEKQSVTDLKPVDLAVSFLSCGFHYPVSTYAEFFRTSVAQGGTIMLDIRTVSEAGQIDDLAPLGVITDLPSPPKARRILLTKPDMPFIMPAPERRAAKAVRP